MPTLTLVVRTTPKDQPESFTPLAIDVNRVFRAQQKGGIGAATQDFVEQMRERLHAADREYTVDPNERRTEIEFIANRLTDFGMFDGVMMDFKGSVHSGAGVAVERDHWEEKYKQAEKAAREAVSKARSAEADATDYRRRWEACERRPPPAADHTQCQRNLDAKERERAAEEMRRKGLETQLAGLSKAEENRSRIEGERDDANKRAKLLETEVKRLTDLLNHPLRPPVNDPKEDQGPKPEIKVEY